MIAVDILKVLLSTNNNRYLLVIQNYFTKWTDAIPFPDQSASRITTEFIKFFCTYGPPQILHSDQGCNFESAILTEVLDAFGVHKSCITPYHPQGDGMVERLNQTLVQLLRTYVISQHDWETYLPHVLYAYRTSQHTATGVSPFLLLYNYMVDSQHHINSQHSWDMICYLTQHISKPDLLNYMILFTQISHRQLICRSQTMTTTPWNPYLFQVTQSGYPYPQQVSLTHGVRGSG